MEPEHKKSGCLSRPTVLHFVKRTSCLAVTVAIVLAIVYPLGHLCDLAIFVSETAKEHPDWSYFHPVYLLKGILGTLMFLACPALGLTLICLFGHAIFVKYVWQNKCYDDEEERKPTIAKCETCGHPTAKSVDLLHNWVERYLCFVPDEQLWSGRFSRLGYVIFGFGYATLTYVVGWVVGLAISENHSKFFSGWSVLGWVMTTVVLIFGPALLTLVSLTMIRVVTGFLSWFCCPVRSSDIEIN